jgi:hypothetical protein
MRTFGEIAIVNDHKTKKMRGKLDNQADPAFYSDAPKTTIEMSTAS